MSFRRKHSGVKHVTEQNGLMFTTRYVPEADVHCFSPRHIQYLPILTLIDVIDIRAQMISDASCFPVMVLRCPSAN